MTYNRALQSREIKLRRGITPTPTFTGDFVDDRKVMLQIGIPIRFSEKDYDKYLFIAGESGFGFSTPIAESS